MNEYFKSIGDSYKRKNLYQLTTSRSAYDNDAAMLINILQIIIGKIIKINLWFNLEKTHISTYEIWIDF